MGLSPSLYTVFRISIHEPLSDDLFGREGSCISGRLYMSHEHWTTLNNVIMHTNINAMTNIDTITSAISANDRVFLLRDICTFGIFLTSPIFHVCIHRGQELHHWDREKDRAYTCAEPLSQPIPHPASTMLRDMATRGHQTCRHCQYEHSHDAANLPLHSLLHHPESPVHSHPTQIPSRKGIAYFLVYL